MFSSQFDEDEIPVEELFRTEKQMPLLERTALQMATGKILDVGAGSGCHSLTLQEAGKEVHAIDISPLSVEVMKQRGERNWLLIPISGKHSGLPVCSTKGRQATAKKLKSGRKHLLISARNGGAARYWE